MNKKLYYHLLIIFLYVNDFYKYPLILAVELGNTEIVKLILSNPDIDYDIYKKTI